MSGERCTKVFGKLPLKANTVSELKVALEKTWENFPQNKAVPSFRNRLREYVKFRGRKIEQNSLMRYFLARPVDKGTHYNSISIEEIDCGDEATIGLYLRLNSFLRRCVKLGYVLLILQRSTDCIIHCRRRRGHSLQKHP